MGIHSICAYSNTTMYLIVTDHVVWVVLGIQDNVFKCQLLTMGRSISDNACTNDMYTI